MNLGMMGQRTVQQRLVLLFGSQRFSKSLFQSKPPPTDSEGYDRITHNLVKFDPVLLTC